MSIENVIKAQLEEEAKKEAASKKESKDDKPESSKEGVGENESVMSGYDRMEDPHNQNTF